MNFCVAAFAFLSSCPSGDVLLCEAAVYESFGGVLVVLSVDRKADGAGPRSFDGSPCC